MSNSILLRSFIMYGVCMLIAVFVGYHVSTWDEMISLGTLMAVLMLMMVPFLLKWHYVWLIASWNMTAIVFFLPGRPSLALALTASSLLISVMQHAINQQPLFIRVRIVFWPLMFLLCVVLATAKLTGGIGLNIAGSTNVGGKRYIYCLGAFLGYFALTAQRIPPEKVLRYVTIFFLSPITEVIGDISTFVGPSAVYYIFLVFPSTGTISETLVPGAPEQIERLSGVAVGAAGVVYTMLARYGLTGIFNGGRLWRAPVFLGLFVVSMLGGYRSTVVTFLLTCTALFYLEGLHKSRFMPVLCCCGLLAAVALVPFAEHLPMAMQRSLTVVPFLKLDEGAVGSAQASSDWRVDMWKEVLPEIPSHLVLGKGYSIDLLELEKVSSPTVGNEGEEGAKLAGDYHNGPLSVIIPFGLGGVIGLIWLLGAGTKVLYRNYKFGDHAFRQVNTYLFAAFVVKIIFFTFVFGSFGADLMGFLGLLGVSVAINGGMREPPPAPEKRPSESWNPARARSPALN